MPIRAQLKDSAKQAMRSTKPNVMIIAMVYFIIVFALIILGLILNYIVVFRGMNPYRFATIIADGELPSVNSIAMMIADWELPSVNIVASSQIIWLVISVMTMMMEFGIISVCLNVSRFKKVGFGSLFSPLTMFFRLWWLKILMSIYVCLWSTLFVIPGIIAQYRYSMAVYILLDNPEFSASECIRRSKEMMVGKKLYLFVLNLSFIGWALLSIVPFVSLYVLPYMWTTRANFYNVLSGYMPEADYAVHNDRHTSTIAIRPSPIQSPASTTDKHEVNNISLYSASDGIADRAQPISISTQELASDKIHMQSGKDASEQLLEDDHLPQIVIRGKFKTGDVREWNPKDFPCFIGRNSFVAQIAVPDSCASRIHARLYIESGILTITDEGATNGTIVNGERISVPTQLLSGDQVTIGETIMCFEISEH